MRTPIVPGTRAKATSKDVARLAGVAQSTVSYYMNGSRPVSKNASARIEAAMKALDYHPNSSARTLRTQRTNLITLIERLSYDSVGSDVIPYMTTIIEEAYRLGYDVILNTTKADPNSLTRMEGRNICDGFILMDIEADDSRIPVAAEIGLPTVVFGQPRDSHGLDCVYFDYAHAGGLIVDYLAAHGTHQVLFLDELADGSGRFLYIRRLYDAMRERCAAHGMDFAVVPFDERDIPAALEAISERIGDRLAIVTRQPQPTKTIMFALERLGVVPGQDLTLLSICPDSRLEGFETKPTNISQMPREVSVTALHTLIDRINDPGRPQVIRPVRADHVTTRETTVDFRRRT